MICPSCSYPLPEQDPIGGVVLCPSCLRSITAATGTLATSAETLALSEEQVKALKDRRKALRAVRQP